MPRFLPIVVILAVVFFAGCGDASSTEQQGTESPEVSFDLRQVDAAQFAEDISEIDADIRIVNIWATWCGPCHVEMPEFVRLHNEDHDNVAVRFLSVDDPQLLPEVEQFITHYRISGPTYFSTVGSGLIQEIHPRWQNGLPTTLMIDRDMKIRDVWEGGVTYDFLIAKIERMRGILADEAANGTNSTSES